jgi:uncharacterized protein
MTIKDELAAELKDAMRSGDAPRKDVIRQIETEVTMARSAPGFSGEVDDDLYRSVMAAYSKKMRKSIDEYEGLGERGAAMAEKLRYEVEYLARWLPRRLGEDETRALVREAIAEIGVAGDPKAAGRVTGLLMQRRRGELDGAVVGRMVREELERP